MKHRFIAAERARYPVRLVCRVIGVAAAGSTLGCAEGRARARALSATLPVGSRRSSRPAGGANLSGRKFKADWPNAVWLTDISYIPTGEGWLYLAAIKDMAMREIVGWSMTDHLRAEPACDARLMAIRRRQPPRGLVLRSDRGCSTPASPTR